MPETRSFSGFTVLRFWNIYIHFIHRASVTQKFKVHQKSEALFSMMFYIVLTKTAFTKLHTAPWVNGLTQRHIIMEERHCWSLELALVVHSGVCLPFCVTVSTPVKGLDVVTARGWFQPRTQEHLREGSQEEGRQGPWYRNISEEAFSNANLKAQNLKYCVCMGYWLGG